MIWDDGKLYVLHPPFLSVYYDDNHTGTANRSEDLVTGISNPTMVASRGADHTTNGIRLGIDGWLYIAVGDFGCPKAIAKDGTQLTFHYGGILRIRPDGSGLEVYSYGHRNIYDIAVDPLMNVLTRDNTNDGDNWNDRLAYIVPTGYYGYPSRFMHFPGEFVDCLADYGGGRSVRITLCRRTRTSRRVVHCRVGQQPDRSSSADARRRKLQSRVRKVHGSAARNRP